MSEATPAPARRLHPVSILFRLARQLRVFAVPGLLVVFGSRSAFANIELLAIWLIVPLGALTVLRHATFRYRTAEHELQVLSGVVFRNVRHIPYSRIHDLTAVRNPFHRLFGVVEARVETGAGSKPEATFSVVSVAEYEALRGLVFARREAPATLDGIATTEPENAPDRVLLRLPTREVALWGLLRGQVGVAVAAMVGGLWQFGGADLSDWLGGRWLKGLANRSETIASVADLPGLLRDVLNGRLLGWDRAALAAASVLGLLLTLRLLSMAWTVVRFHGFHVVLSGDDVKTEFGLLTRVSASLPRHRLQAVVVREGPLQRRLGRVSVRAQTAGGGSGPELDGETGQRNSEASSLKDREWLAPILRRSALREFLAPLLAADPAAPAPEFDLATAEWQPVNPRAVRRAFRSWLRIVALPILVLAPFLGRWTPLPALLLLAWAWLAARGEIAGLRWAATDGTVLLRSGWLWRRLLIVPFDRIQTVSLFTSPRDRRAGMARVRVDTAGGGALGDRFDIPYLSDGTARALASRLEREAAASRFRW